MYDMDIQQLVPVPPELVGLIETAVTAVLQHEAVAPPAGLALVLSDDAHLQQLNSAYRHIDAPTDVLSFPAPDVPGMEAYLGDIIISVAYAQRQASAEGHTLAAELQLLAVHGVLHLLGYDHMEPDEKAEMWAAQTAVLTSLGVHMTLPEE